MHHSLNALIKFLVLYTKQSKIFSCGRGQNQPPKTWLFCILYNLNFVPNTTLIEIIWNICCFTVFSNFLWPCPGNSTDNSANDKDWQWDLKNPFFWDVATRFTKYFFFFLNLWSYTLEGRMFEFKNRRTQQDDNEWINKKSPLPRKYYEWIS